MVNEIRCVYLKKGRNRFLIKAVGNLETAEEVCSETFSYQI
jgi:hypothetical protein